jgi:tRNA(fMet)-specific endonuclease VapC
MKYLLDTNTCIYLLNGTHPKLASRTLSTGPARIALSVMTVAELEFGAARSRKAIANQRRVDAFVDEIQVVPFNADAARTFGELKAKLVSAGKKVGDFDVAIAACAMMLDYVVVSHDADFKKIPGVRIEDWVIA